MGEGIARREAGRDVARALARAEFDPGNLTIWVEGLRRKGLGLALPALILKLDVLAKADLPPRWRVGVLRLLKRPVLKAAASLPKPVGGLHPGGSGVTLEQRLLLLMQANCRQVLTDLNRLEYSSDPDSDEVRAWACRNLFGFLERHIRYGMDWDVPCPVGTWQAAHDLYTLLTERGHLAVLGQTELFPADPDGAEHAHFDPANAYKRLLLLGIASLAKPRAWDEGALHDGLGAWAEESLLDAPEVHTWDAGVYMVEVGQDAPLRFNPKMLGDPFNGWVLVPAEGFLACIGRAGATSTSTSAATFP